MLGDTELALWFQRLRIPETSQTTIHQVRSSDPTRRVGSRRYNVSGRYPSKKMGAMIQFESHRVELAEIYVMEHDRAVHEYYDQPPPIKLSYKSAAGRPLGVLHTPDYFVLRDDGAGWIECKTEEELSRLAQSAPNRYAFKDGRWRCAPGELFAEQFGFTYTVRSSRDINWAFQANLQFLEDYFGSLTSLQPDKADRVYSYVAASPGITLDALFSELGDSCSRDDVYLMIAEDRLFVNLRAARLNDQSRVRVFPTSIAAEIAQPDAQRRAVPVGMVIEAGCTVSWDSKPWKVANSGENTVSLLGEGRTLTELPHDIFDHLVRNGQITSTAQRPGLPQDSEALARISAANEAELQHANYRYVRVGEFLSGAHSDSTVPERTLRRWVAQYRQAEQLFGNGFVGLLSDTSRKGNGTPKLPQATRSLMEEFIAQDYETLKQKNRRSCWIKLRMECEKRSLVAPSYRTFRLAIKNRSGFSQTLKRKGYRAACQEGPFYYELDLKTPKHGVRPFEVGHVDHTQLDLELVCSLTGRPLGRPWLTILTDAFSRRFLAFYLTFDSPSYRSCMMVLRECVYRHGKLSQTIVVDGGREFGSIYFETLLARYQCTKKTRPPAQARFGSVCERLFGTTNTQLVYNLRGNTQITRHSRQVTKGVQPRGQAVWPLKELTEQLAQYCYEIYDTMDHATLGQSPREAFQAGIASSGHRSHRIIPYDREFFIYTLPSPLKATAKVVPGRGIKTNYLYYWCELFRSNAIENSRVEIRYDPFDVSTAYAFIDGSWVECHSEYHNAFQGHSEKEVRIAAEEIRKRWKNHSQRFPVTAKRLAQLIASAETQETVLAQRLRDMEARKADTGTVRPRADSGAK